MIKIISVRTGFQSVEALIQLLEEFRGKNSVVQIFEPEGILSPTHILFSYYHALKAFKKKKQIAHTLNNELLLRTAATRKITHAIERVGAKNPDRVILFIKGEKQNIGEILNKMDANEDKKLIKLTKKKMKNIISKFGIEKEKIELYSLEELLLEKIALLDIII